VSGTTLDVDSIIRTAAALRQAGRFLEAEHAYKVVLSNEPNHPDCWYNLALTQRQIGRFESALACYEEALKYGVAKPEEVRLNRGVILSDFLRRPDEAENELNIALDLNPRYTPALLNLANLKEERGDRDAAVALYDRILAIDPTDGEARARWAKLQRIEGPQDPLATTLRNAIANPRSNVGQKASLSFALAKLLDECAAYDDAFDAYTAANRHSRAMPESVLYDRGGQEQVVDELIEVFTPEQARLGARPVDDPPIFICGMFRSGSTLVEQVLASHPTVTAGGEVEFVPRLSRAADLSPYPWAMKTVSSEKLASLAQQYRAYMAKVLPGATRTTDKRPDNFLHIGLIKSLFPNARIIHTTRNPLDNCLSVYFTHLDYSAAYALDLMDTAHHFAQYRRLMAHWKKLYGADILDFDYDAFVRDPKPAVERLLAFCGLDWDDACMSFHRSTNPVKTASVWQVREPIYRRASGRWQNYAKHLDQVRAKLNELDGDGAG
jgi:tetratricopeptide (TPR) repeat protein